MGLFCADAVRPPFLFIFVFKYSKFLEVFSIAATTHEINEQIRDPQVRLISAEGEQLGIVSAEEALHIATEAGYDLVKIAPNSAPPVCRIMDYGKFRFEQAKKEKEAKKNQRVIEIKEIRMSPGIDTNDFNTKLKNAQKFLQDGDRVKVSVRFRGREMAHTEIGADLLKDFGVLDLWMKKMPLPGERSEFEDRARLFAVMRGLEEFLQIKKEFMDQSRKV